MAKVLLPYKIKKSAALPKGYKKEMSPKAKAAPIREEKIKAYKPFVN